MNQKKKRELVQDFLLRVGIAPNIKGFATLTEAVLIAAEEPSVMEAVTKKLYPAVAQKVGTTASCAEHAIRRAIETCFERGNVEEIMRSCKLYPKLNKGKYSNSEFISAVALLVRREFCE